MDSNNTFATLSSLIKKDLKDAYFLPAWPSTYSKGYRFLNDKQYRVFDYPPPSLNFNEFQFPMRNLATAGSDVPILTDRQPAKMFKEHWRKWLPAFAPATIKTIDEGLEDDVPIVTTGAMQGIPVKKQAIHPDALYKVQLKSAIPEINAPSPREMTKNNVAFPCVLKVDQAWSGRGTQIARNWDQLQAMLKEIKEMAGWKDGYLIQEAVTGIKDVPSFQFYVTKLGEVHWVGTTVGGFTGFKWTSALVDWEQQDQLRDLVYEEFTVPIKNYLQKHGYFGLVTFEVLLTDHGRYLVDVNPRVGGDTTHLLIAPYMAHCGFTKSALVLFRTYPFSSKKLIAKANEINNRDTGRIIVLSAADVVEGCQADVSVFAKSNADLRLLCDELTGNPSVNSNT